MFDLPDLLFFFGALGFFCLLGLPLVLWELRLRWSVYCCQRDSRQQREAILLASALCGPTAAKAAAVAFDRAAA